MNYWDRKLMREQVDEKLRKLHILATQNFQNGWIKIIREALGMSTKQLAKRVGVDQSRISRLENAEAAGDLKLSSLKKIAAGLNMKFVYGFVSDTTLEDMVHEQAKKIASARMQKLNHTMRLEQQELGGKEKEKALDDMIQKILINEPKEFWDK
jgi:predicted DNA-binding mobile mystery protein A